jgi:polysaccharide export outer membrane protein
MTQSHRLRHHDVIEVELPIHWTVMRSRKWFSDIATAVLFLGIAVAQNRSDLLPYTEIRFCGAGAGGPLIFASALVGTAEPTTDGGLSAQQKETADSSATAATAEISANTNAQIPQGATKSQDLQPDPNDYIIGEQDALMITVWKEKEISGGVVVRPDGKITVPLIGEIKVVGMTPVQLQGVLAEKLKPFVTVPQVTVAVTQINSRKIYLIGQAAREGHFLINSSTTVLQVIAEAGGLRDFAKRKKIYILRNQGQKQLRFSFDYDAVIRGKKEDQNILLQPGDTIVVP